MCSSEPPEVAPSLWLRVQAFWSNCRLWWSLPTGALGSMAKDQGQCQLSSLSSCVWTEKESVITFCCGHCVLRNLQFQDGGLCRRAFSQEGLAGQPGGPWRGWMNVDEVNLTFSYIRTSDRRTGTTSSVVISSDTRCAFNVHLAQC